MFSNITSVYICTIIFVLIADFVWLSVNKPMYNALVRGVQKQNIKVNFTYAIPTYVIILISMFFFAIPFVNSKLKKRNDMTNIIIKSLIFGGGIGFCIYGIFNLTNASIFANYNIRTGVIDTLWGTALYASVCILFITLSRRIKKTNI